MQLKKKASINAALAAATCALLGNQAQAQSDDKPDDWRFDTAILYYGETDRVTAVEGVFNANKDLGDGRIFNGKLVVDALTGASASGAVSQPNIQTFTRPSGNGQYTVAPNETPLDDTFRDTRVQLDGSWTQPLVKDMRGTAGLHLSKEYDYLSIGVSGTVEKDFNRKNTTASFGLSYAFDRIDPEGGRPIPFSSMVVDQGQFTNEDAYRNAFESTRQIGTDDKDTVDVLFGVTQVINRRMLMQFNYSYSNSDGYHTDPFKVLSVVNDQGITQDILHESRPDKRTKHSVYWQTKYAFDTSVLDVSYRFSTDDWEVDSHTIDSRYRFNLTDSTYIQPHFRYYQQSAAEFFNPFLMEAEQIPEYATADYRLGEMSAFTLGLKYGMQLQNGHELGFRIEYYQQDPKNAGFLEPGALADQDLYPSVKAVIAQVSYRF